VTLLLFPRRAATEGKIATWESEAGETIDSMQKLDDFRLTIHLGLTT
jgi:hypothetical protein